MDIQNKNIIQQDIPTPSEINLNLKVKFRFCSERDLHKLEWFGMFREHRYIFRQQFQRHRKNENIMLIAEFNKFPVGQLWIDLKILAPESTALIWALRVHPIMQNQGLGTLLIQKAERIISHNKFCYAQIEVEKKNKKAKVLYERLGYIIFAEKDECWSFTSPNENLIEQRSHLYTLRKHINLRPTNDYNNSFRKLAESHS